MQLLYSTNGYYYTSNNKLLYSNQAQDGLSYYFCCALIHMSQMFILYIKNGAIILFSCKAVSYLFYPLLGWMADLGFARYKFVLFFFIALILESILAIATSAVTLGFPQDHWHSPLMYYPAGLVIVIAIGLFESIAICMDPVESLSTSNCKRISLCPPLPQW